MASEANGVAVVTGAARGIGKAIALRLGQDGYDVVVNDVPLNKEKLEAVAKELTSLGRRSFAHLADVSVESEVKEMVDKVVRDFGGLDVMVANAGVFMYKSLFDQTVEEWERIFSVNVTGTFLCFKYAGMQMVSQGRGGRMIAACSVAGKKGGTMFSAYSASKFALRGLIQSAASELGPHRITVNAYAPGPISTDMLTAVDEGISQAHGVEPGAYLETVGDRTSLKRKGTPEEVANLVAFLVSKENMYITGQSILCDGGMHFD